jgi:hypothetical protein
VSTAPLILAVTSQGKIKDLRCGEDVVADEGSADRGLDSAPALVWCARSETQARLVLAQADVNELARQLHLALFLDGQLILWEL